MTLVLSGKDVEVGEVVQQYATDRMKRLNGLFCTEPDVNIVLRTNDSESNPVIAELAVSIRSYRTLKASGKASDARSAIDKAAKKLEWKYRLFWARGSFRFGDCC